MDKENEGYVGSVGMEVKGISEIVEETLENYDFLTREDARKRDEFHTSLEGMIRRTFEEHKSARDQAGVDSDMIQSLYQVNGEYTQDELASMVNRSNIFMNLTATKKRAGESWIKDILQPANAFPMEFRPTPVEELPKEIEDSIRDAFERDQEQLVQKIRQQFQQQQAPQQPTQEGQQPAPQQAPQPSALSASRELRQINELRRDIHEAITAEINKVSRQQCNSIQNRVMDSLKEGKWDVAFSEFISDFLIFPTAFMKGPIVTTKKRLTYVNGKPTEVRDYVFLNKRVSPFDVYPSPSAESIYDGAFIEHIRLSKKELSDLGHLGPETGFYSNNVIECLKESPNTTFIDSGLEAEKALAEKRANQTYSNSGIYHGLHYWGTASVSCLREWGLEDKSLDTLNDWEEVEIEAIMVNDKIIKCLVNKDPLGRRPYYCASYSRKAGSIWGKSMPSSMRDIQRMCNGVARALADNMGFSAGPQCAILVDRLADDGEIEEQRPLKIWQFTSDPQGNGGRPIEWFTIPSNATELLGVYDKFEMKADDVTGIPRYSYGNEQVGGAGQTMGGLSILMESASKGIKSAIKNISEGVIVPRAEYQFYLELLKAGEADEDIQYHGDINVVVYAAEAITLKAAEQEVQRELLKATMNPTDLQIVGAVGRADMLRHVFKTANFPEDIVPSRLEVKINEEDRKTQEAQAAQQQQQIEQAKVDKSIQATTIQVEGQKEMHKETQANKTAIEQERLRLKSQENQLKAIEIEQKPQLAAMEKQTKADISSEANRTKAEIANRKLAVEVQKAGQSTQPPQPNTEASE